MDIEVSEGVLAHFRRPCRVGRWDPALAAVGTGWAGSPESGNLLRLQIRVADDTIVDSRFKAFGSAWTIAAGSYLAETLVGKTLEEALNLGDNEIAAALALPPLKIRAAVLAVSACRSAVGDFREKNRSNIV